MDFTDLSSDTIVVTNVDLTGSDFTGCNMSNVLFSGCILNRVVFKESINDCRFENCRR